VTQSDQTPGSSSAPDSCATPLAFELETKASPSRTGAFNMLKAIDKNPRSVFSDSEPMARKQWKGSPAEEAAAASEAEGPAMLLELPPPPPAEAAVPAAATVAGESASMSGLKPPALATSGSARASKSKGTS